ncbi:MAG: class I SAM-dependent methyltransferase [Gemmatimonadota bacterium]|nr:class I SAM-dependent methyltransferase [Gemmatimonadota bacterium]
MKSAEGGAYNRAYFDKWYRNPIHRVKSAALLSRQVGFVLHAAEWVLGRQVRSVLDVGCGEANWRQPLRRIRPALRYTGVDPSAYAVQRFGKRRNIQLGSIENLSELLLDSSFDLVVCCGMLNYVPADTLAAGLRAVAARTGGMAYLEIFTERDATEGDTSWPAPKSAAWYRSAFSAAGLTSIGLHCYVPRAQHAIAELEQAFP